MIDCKFRVVAVQQYRQAGITLLEVVIALIIFSVMLGMTLERIYHYQGEAERAAVIRLVANMRAALNSKQYQAVLIEKRLDGAAIALENPMTWLQSQPDNYRGEISDFSRESLVPGSWYFDTSAHKLVYVFSGKKSFLGDSFERWYFKVKFGRLPTENAKPDGAPAMSDGVALIQVDG